MALNNVSTGQNSLGVGNSGQGCHSYRETAGQQGELCEREGGPASTSAMKGGHRKHPRFPFRSPWRTPWHTSKEQNSYLFLHLKPVLRPCHL